nr:glycoside hydrolase family 2 TIM barrel-domain containing protein [Palleniella intestinalis]
MNKLHKLILSAALAVSSLVSAQNLQKGDYGYLYCHMSDRGEWTAYALSRDGLHYHDLIGGQPIFDTKKVAGIEGGTRDAYIFRKHDGKGYLMLTTDMCVKKSKVWNNYGINLLTSDDLINWESKTFDFRKGASIFSDPKSPDTYKNYATINRVWAPQAMWDPTYVWPNGKKGGYFVYYSLWNSAEEKYDRMYYSYADESFTTLTKPRLLFDWGYATIDADINYLKSDKLFHMMIKKEGGKPGLFTATAKKLTGPWSEPVEDDYVNFEGKKKCEGVSAFQIAGEEGWRVGYIEYSSRPKHYRICKADKYLRNFNSPQDIIGVEAPQHGSFLRLTKEEYDRLENWSKAIMDKKNTTRTVLSLNSGWQFHASATDKGIEDIATIGNWQTVNLPHDFQISQPWVAPAADEKADNRDAGANIRSRLSSRGFKEMGFGWYRKSIRPEESWRGKRVLLDFEGIMLVGDVYLNGKHIGKTDYGYLGFEIDITKLLNYGKDNIIAVKASTQQPLNSRWYTGGGLYRDVNIILTDKDEFFVRHPLYITTENVSDRKATVNVQAELTCNLKVENLRVGTKVTDRAGNIVYHKFNTIKFDRRMRTNEHQVAKFDIDNPKLWSCETPNLYTAEVTLYREDGSVADQVTKRFGVRNVEFSPEFGLKLNGKKVLLKGIANHHSLGALGAAVYPRAMEKRIKMLKDFGFNHIRTAHNPYSESFLDLCDEYGILVVDELYDKWLTQYAGGREEWTNLWQHDVPEFVKRDRNHPSVVVWSLGNELQQYWNLPYADWGVTAYRLQKELLRRYDKTRPITVAMHPRYRSLETDSLPAPLVHETDIASYNYRYMYFPGDSRRFPHMMFYQSEANTSGMGPNYFEMDLDKVLGLAYWGMIDYLGESQGWPEKGWCQGVFDISLEPKPNAYFLKSYFKDDEPLVHIGIVASDGDSFLWNDEKMLKRRLVDHWNFGKGNNNEEFTLYTYTNADEVELRINGKSLGRKQNDKNPKVHNRIKWDKVKYESGYIEAIAYTNGKVVARHKIETTGEAKRLSATADNSEWKADGKDLQHIRILALDAKGRRVQTAKGKVHFSVEGPAEIIAVTNGDNASDELAVGDSRDLYNGTCTVILRSKQGAGKVSVTATCDGMKPVKLQLATK